MGNHFRTSGAGENTPQATPDVASAAAAQADTGAADLSDQYEALAAQRLQQNAQTQTQEAAAPAAQPAQAAATAASGLFDAIPDPAKPSAEPVVEADQAKEVASLNNALNSPEFTSVFAPVDVAAHRKKMAQQAGVEPVILMEHVTKIYPSQPNKPALDDINIEVYPGEFVFLVGHSGSGKTTLLSTINRDVADQRARRGGQGAFQANLARREKARRGDRGLMP